MLTYTQFEDGIIVHVLAHFTNVMFFIETAVKVVADSGSCKHFMEFMRDPWNAFDVIVLVSLIVLAAVAGTDYNSRASAGAVRVLRLFRLLRALRVLRAVKVFPQLVRASPSSELPSLLIAMALN